MYAPLEQNFLFKNTICIPTVTQLKQKLSKITDSDEQTDYIIQQKKVSNECKIAILD